MFFGFCIFAIIALSAGLPNKSRSVVSIEARTIGRWTGSAATRNDSTITQWVTALDSGDVAIIRFANGDSMIMHCTTKDHSIDNILPR